MKQKSILVVLFAFIVAVAFTACGAKEYQVTFDLDGGTGTIAKQTVEEGGKVTKPTDEPTKTGYRFDGWLKGEAAYGFENAVNADLTLKAKWVKTYTVTFAIGEGATGKPDNQIIDDGSKAIEPTADPTKTDFDFDGWQDSEGTAFDFNTAITADITLTAVYSPWAVKSGFVGRWWGIGSTTDLATEKTTKHYYDISITKDGVVCGRLLNSGAHSAYFDLEDQNISMTVVSDTKITLTCNDVEYPDDPAITMTFDLDDGKLVAATGGALYGEAVTLGKLADNFSEKISSKFIGTWSGETPGFELFPGYVLPGTEYSFTIAEDGSITTTSGFINEEKHYYDSFEVWEYPDNNIFIKYSETYNYVNLMTTFFAVRFIYDEDDGTLMTINIGYNDELTLTKETAAE